MGSKEPPSAVVSAGYLMLDTSPPLALPASRVLGIVRAAEWNTSPMLAFGELIPVRFGAEEPAWVLRIGSSVQSIAALVSGRMRVDYLRTEALLSMPDLSCRGFDYFSDVVLAQGKPVALVVNIDALFRVHPEMGE